MKNNSNSHKSTTAMGATSPGSSAGSAGGAAVPVPGSSKVPNPEVLERAQRRSFSAEYKQRVLREADAAKASGDGGAVGALLRREGLYSSHLTAWRKQRESGELAGLTPAKRGRKAKRRDEVTLENERLRRENARLQEELRKASIVIAVQKKVAALLGNPIEDDPTERT